MRAPGPIRVMGIVNATPDSFSDGGKHVGASAIAWGRKLFADGASIVDVGGESTRPGATVVSADEEMDRVLPVIEGLERVLAGRATISIDTYKAATAHAAVRIGATVVNLRQHAKSRAGAANSNAGFEDDDRGPPAA